MAETVIISIGRNYGSVTEEYFPGYSGQPMGDAAWDLFRDRTFQLAEKYGEVVFFGDGQGVYEGQEEESYTVIFVAHDDYNVGYLPAAGCLAELFMQDSIAVTAGTTVFAKASWA